MYTPKQEPSYAYNPPPPAPPPPPPAPPPPPPEPQSAPVPPPPPITAPTPQPAPIFEAPQPPQPPMQQPQEYEFMQNGFNVDDTPAYIQVPKGAAGNAAVQLPQEPAYTPPAYTPPPPPIGAFEPFAPMNPNIGIADETGFFMDTPPPPIGAFEPFAPMNPNIGIADETGFFMEPPVVTPEPAPTPPPAPVAVAPAYTPPAQNFFEEQNQRAFQFDDTGGFGRFGGYGRDLDDRYYEQMFSKGGIAKLLYRR